MKNNTHTHTHTHTKMEINNKNVSEKRITDDKKDAKVSEHERVEIIIFHFPFLILTVDPSSKTSTYKIS